MKKSNKATKLFSVLIAVVMLLGVISVGMMASAADRGVWDANTQYNGGDRVTYNGIVYEAKYWINSNEASPDKNTGWKKVLAEGEIPTWDADAIYASGDQVIYQGNVYKASWDPGKEVPGSDQYGAWKLIGPAPTDPTDPVVVPVKEVTLDPPTATLKVGGTTTLTAKVTPDNATDKTVTWESSDDSIATVDQNGKVTAIGVGTATITVKSVSNPEAFAGATITVKLPKITGFPITIKLGETIGNDGSQNIWSAETTIKDAQGQKINTLPINAPGTYYAVSSNSWLNANIEMGTQYSIYVITVNNDASVMIQDGKYQHISWPEEVKVTVADPATNYGKVEIIDDVYVLTNTGVDGNGNVGEVIGGSETPEVEVDANLKFAGASLNLQNNLQINFKVLKSQVNGYTNLKAVCKRGDNAPIDIAPVDDGDYWTFTFTNIAPHLLGDTIEATLYGNDANGDPQQGKTINYSVKDYCYSGISSNDPRIKDDVKKMLVDLLNYGAAAQVYKKSTVELVNSDLGDYAALGTQEPPVLNKKPENTVFEGATVKWTGANLLLDDSINMRIYLSDVTDITVKVNGKEISEFGSDNDGTYVEFNAINAAKMRNVFEFIAYRADAQVSDGFKFSVESYAFAAQNNTQTDGLANLVVEMMKYGDSAKAYADSIK